MVMNRYSRLVVGSLLMLFASSAAIGCTCSLFSPDKSISEQVKRARAEAKAVFVGKVLTVETPAGLSYHTVTMEIQTMWKGTYAEKLTLTTARSGSCGFPFEQGGKYLVYAYLYNKTHLATTICQRTTVYRRDLIDLKYLGKATFPAERRPGGGTSLVKTGRPNQ